jgi:PIN domain nuclease of toxin-antitoxin system
VRFLIDTQVLITLSQQGTASLSVRARNVVEDEDSELLLSTVSITEIAVKAIIQKLTITAEDIRTAIEDLRLSVISFERRHTMQLFDLPLHHRDPFDRMLIATALSEGVPILSADKRFRSYRGLKIIL